MSEQNTEKDEQSLKIMRLERYMKSQNPQTREMIHFKKGYLQCIYDVCSVLDYKLTCPRYGARTHHSFVRHEKQEDGSIKEIWKCDECGTETKY